jgi:hypothetical protein
MAKRFTHFLSKGNLVTGDYPLKEMSKEGNLFARFFSGLALPSLRYQSSRIRGKGPDSTGILRDTPGTDHCINASNLL